MVQVLDSTDEQIKIAQDNNRSVRQQQQQREGVARRGRFRTSAARHTCLEAVPPHPPSHGLSHSHRWLVPEGLPHHCCWTKKRTRRKSWFLHPPSSPCLRHCFWTCAFSSLTSHLFPHTCRRRPSCPCPCARPCPSCPCPSCPRPCSCPSCPCRAK